MMFLSVLPSSRFHLSSTDFVDGSGRPRGTLDCRWCVWIVFTRFSLGSPRTSTPADRVVIAPAPLSARRCHPPAPRLLWPLTARRFLSMTYWNTAAVLVFKGEMLVILERLHMSYIFFRWRLNKLRAEGYSGKSRNNEYDMPFMYSMWFHKQNRCELAHLSEEIFWIVMKQDPELQQSLSGNIMMLAVSRTKWLVANYVNTLNDNHV